MSRLLASLVTLLAAGYAHADGPPPCATPSSGAREALGRIPSGTLREALRWADRKACQGVKLGEDLVGRAQAELPELARKGRRGATRILTLAVEALAAPPAARGPDAGAGPAPRSRPAAPVRVVAPGRVEIEHARVEAALADLEGLRDDVAVAPADDGRGFVVVALERGSLPWELGLRRGDTIRAVNGHALTSVERAVLLYARLRPQLRPGGRFLVELTPAPGAEIDRPRSLEITIR